MELKFVPYVCHIHYYDMRRCIIDINESNPVSLPRKACREYLTDGITKMKLHDKLDKV